MQFGDVVFVQRQALRVCYYGGLRPNDDEGGSGWSTDRVVPVLQIALSRDTGPMQIVHAIAPDVSLWVPQLEGVA